MATLRMDDEMNASHIINHKYQLFAYLKALGVPLGTRDLYVWRGR